MLQLDFNKVKNTVFLFVLVLISCGNFSQTEGETQVKHNNTKNTSSLDSLSAFSQAHNDETIIVGANQTEDYLPLLNGKRVGIVANQTSVIFKNDNYIHLVDSLLKLNINVKKVFSPEHGFRGTADAGELVSDGIDTKTGLPIVSLHGKNKKPTQKQLADLDVVIFDIQDVGVRFYTYISSLHYVMEACAEENKTLLIFDRPNPNGHYVDGPTLETENKSFLGMHPIPLVHGLTIGEYATMINGEKWLKNGLQSNITIIPIKNYTHQTPYSLPLRPSPNLPNDQSIKLYPSLGLFEGTNINAGRGTEFQFQRYGAPFLNPKTMTFTYTPEPNFGAKNPKHKNKVCYGEDLSDVKIDGMTLKWIIKAYQNSTDKSLFFLTDGFTKHAGTAKLQQQIEAGLTEKEIRQTWQEDLETFKKTRKKYLLYE
ncbi:exo-beta-N-acetylmuramidase NamZ family protein [Hanstruepera ponticola]|uniref:exo-beta-N-acetylmuramidase NamZ family protein n=1 Tax=Hanstruepera ponticola TaxID=2042995 RepID=UPI00177EE780|nr:DUF1343 domain-containing protein [Hanstruepera ponticola]